MAPATASGLLGITHRPADGVRWTISAKHSRGVEGVPQCQESRSRCRYSTYRRAPPEGLERLLFHARIQFQVFAKHLSDIRVRFGERRQSTVLVDTSRSGVVRG